MRIKEVEFPETILSAQKAGGLAIFAGAGVSIPHPSNLPNFQDLSNRVVAGALTREAEEPVDRFLGRAHARGVKVHQRVVDELVRDPTSAPNELHSALLRLFRSRSDVRLVTTNFDRHFTSAAATVFGSIDELEFQYAPALPLGDKFTGIVYLHGSVDKPPERLVLTDADFGRAYLTEGWARRFLQRLFSAFTVLFVGYSYQDIVLQYLARGLPPDARPEGRFAMVSEGNEQHWKYLGITPISYPLKPSENRHSALLTTLSAWGDLAHRGALDHEVRIRQIVELPPSLDLEESDYLVHVIKDHSIARFFTRHATKVEWLHWAEKQGLFESLFQPSVTPERVDEVIALWFAENFVIEHPGDALALVHRQGQTPGPLLWNTIARRLAGQQSNGVPPEVLDRWVAVLIADAPFGANTELLANVMCACRYPENQAAAVLLFGFLTRPRVRLEKDIFRLEADRDGGDDVSAGVSLHANQYWLVEAWQRVFKPDLANLADQLEPLLTSHLQQAHTLLCMMGKAHESHDLLSFSRGAIEQNEAAGGGSAVDAMIDAAGGLLAHYVTNSPARADSVIEAWFRSKAPLLKRLAIWGVAISSHWTADTKIEWVLRSNLLYAYGIKHEVFVLLKKAYPTASQSSRSILLEQVSKRPPAPSDPESKRIRDYEIYNLLNWLKTADPSCPLVKQHLDSAQRLHPEFGPRDHPDRDWVITFGAWGSESPVSSDALISMDPEERFDEFMSYQEKGVIGPGREGLLAEVEKAVAQDYGWGLRLAGALEKKERWDSDLARCLVAGWRRAQLTDAQWQSVLGFLLSHDQLVQAAAYEVALLLESGVERPENPIPSSEIKAALAVAQTCWSGCSLDAPTADSQKDDWLATAINDPAGKLSTFWLHAVSRMRQEAGDRWTGIPPWVKALPELMLTEATRSAELGRVVLASRLHFLFAIDQIWAKDNIIPLLDWSIDERRALQTWHGFLCWGRWTEGLLQYLMPLYEGVFPRCDQLTGNYSGRFCEHLAAIAAFSSIHPVKQGWLARFLLAARPVDRASWAAHFRQMLESMDEEAQKASWESWIGDYWRKRIDGIPLPLDSSETEEMVNWCIHLKPVFPEVVDKICESPRPTLTHTFIFWSLARTDLPKRFPRSSGQLLRQLLVSVSEPFYDFDNAQELVGRLVPTDASREDLLWACNELARLGYPGAAELRALINPPPSP